jgi:hypothetical protein
MSKTLFHPELFVIHSKERDSVSGLSRHYRLKTKLQLLYVVAGGTSFDHTVPYTQHRVVTKDGQEYLQISKWYYDKNLSTFVLVMTFQDEQKFKREAMSTPALTDFIKEKKTDE